MLDDLRIFELDEGLQGATQCGVFGDVLCWHEAQGVLHSSGSGRLLCAFLSCGYTDSTWINPLQFLRAFLGTGLKLKIWAC